MIEAFFGFVVFLVWVVGVAWFFWLLVHSDEEKVIPRLNLILGICFFTILVIGIAVLIKQML